MSLLIEKYMRFHPYSNPHTEYYLNAFRPDKYYLHLGVE
jgi:hypothetical protein